MATDNPILQRAGASQQPPRDMLEEEVATKAASPQVDPKLQAIEVACSV